MEKIEADRAGDSDIAPSTAIDLMLSGRIETWIRKADKSMLSATVAVLVPVLFVLLLGYFAWRVKAFDTDQVAGINELALDFALPASLFVGIVSIPRSQLAQDASFALAMLADLVGLYVVALVLATDGHLPFPYGRETTGYEVADLTDTLRKATNAGVKILVAPYRADQRHAAMVQFPGGYIAEIHSEVKK